MPTSPAANSKPGRGRGAAGFSLLEVAAALLVAGLGLIAVLRLASYSDEERALAQGKLVVLRQARSVLDEWMSRPDLEPGVYRGKTSEGWLYRVRATLQEDEAPQSPTTTQDKTRGLGARFNPRRGLPRRFSVQVCLSPGPGTSGEGLCLESGSTLNKVN